MSTYVTVAIPYVNAEPHLGYAYELVQADIYARARRLAGDQVRFLGGTDDHALKNVLAAEAAGLPTDVFVDANAERFAALGRPLGVAFDDFLRTSADPRHRPAVERLWRACAANGDLYQRTYEGEYCVGCERFYDRAELVTGDGVAALPRAPPPSRACRRDELVLPPVPVPRPPPSADLRRRADDPPAAVPRRGPRLHRRRSRGHQRVAAGRRARGWGIPVPDDPTQVIYVWFDALTNYLSALEFGDPDSVAYRRWWLRADRRVHVIGKGILRFHAVYWPAFLAAAHQPAPTHLAVHPYLTIDGAKISKSGAPTISPFTVVDRYGQDAVRWWFARDVGPVVDTDFTERRLVERVDGDLANGVGNVANRIVTLAPRVDLTGALGDSDRRRRRPGRGRPRRPRRLRPPRRHAGHLHRRRRPQPGPRDDTPVGADPPRRPGQCRPDELLRATSPACGSSPPRFVRSSRRWPPASRNCSPDGVVQPRLATHLQAGALAG